MLTSWVTMLQTPKFWRKTGNTKKFVTFTNLLIFPDLVNLIDNAPSPEQPDQLGCKRVLPVYCKILQKQNIRSTDYPQNLPKATGPAADGSNAAG